MKEANINTQLIDGPADKLELISKLTLSVKADISKKKNGFYKAFGAWESSQNADQIITDIRDSRTFNRQIEQF